MKILPVISQHMKKDILGEAQIFWQKLLSLGIKEEHINPDVILVFGGDGTLLGAQRKYCQLNKMYIGIGFGTVNYLLHQSLHSPKELYRKLVENKWDKFSMQGIKAEIVTDKNTQSGRAFNDVYIKAMDPTKVITTKIYTKEYDGLELVGDGIVVATPQGSTAYSKNAGGATLPLDSNSWTLTGIATRQKSFHVSIARQEVIIKITQGEALAVTDNKKFLNVKEVRLRLSKQKTIIGFDKNENFEQRRYNE